MTARESRSSAAAIERALRAAGNPERAAHERRYLRSRLEHVGASVPSIRKAIVAFAREQPNLDRAALLDLAAALWSRGVHECRMAAVELLELRVERLLPEDLGGIVEQLIREARTWALVDGLSASVAGALVERDPALGATLDRWARDEDFWVRRAALLAELIALREGRGDFERFGRHADAMLEEREFFVRKAIGWVLRDASRRNPERVAAWLLPRAARASPLTIREGTKHLSPSQRDAIRAAASVERDAPDPAARRAPGSSRRPRRRSTRRPS